MAASLSDYKDGFAATGYAGSSTIGPVSIIGGKYGLLIHDTGTPDATLQTKAPDGSYVNVAAAITSNGFSTYDLPNGEYQITTGTGTLLAAALLPIPYKPA